MEPIIKFVLSLIAPLTRRVVNMLARAVVNSIDDSKKLQLAQVEILSGEVRADVERFQNYGFTSVPKKGAEAIVVRLGGHADHTIILCIDDRTYRLRNLESGEVAMYDATGSTVIMKSNGDIEVAPSSGKVKFTGDVDVSGTLTADTDCVGGGKSLKDHTHMMATTGSPLVVTTSNAIVGSPSTATSATPSGPGSITGSTDKPT